MEYNPHPAHYLIPACLVGAGILLSFVPGWGLLGLVMMCLLATIAAAFITVTGYWESKGSYWRGLAELTKTLPTLTAQEKEGLRLAAPEIGFLLQAGKPNLVLASGSICSAKFFQEFLDKSNPQTTWAKRDVEPTDQDTREVRRRQWDDLCHYLNHTGYLVARPSGTDSWMWRPGGWRELYSKFVGSLPNLGEDPAPEGWGRVE